MHQTHEAINLIKKLLLFEKINDFDAVSVPSRTNLSHRVHDENSEDNPGMQLPALLEKENRLPLQCPW